MLAFFTDHGLLVLYAGYALLFGATFIVARMFFQEQEVRELEQNLDELKSRKASDPLVKFTRPFFTQYVVPMVRGKPNWDGKRQTYRRKLVTAGLKDELTPDEFISFKFFLILFFPFVLAILHVMDVYEAAWYYMPGAAIIGWFYPDFWIKMRIEKRQRQVLKAMPFIVDLLALSTEAGLDFVGAIGKVVDKAAPSPLVEEMEQALKEIRVGSSRAEALREMATRVDLIEMSSFVAILISADQMGASIGKILRQQSEQIRNQRFVRAEKAGAAASQKLLIPLIIFILPAVMLLIFGPFALEFIYPNGR